MPYLGRFLGAQLFGAISAQVRYFPCAFSMILKYPWFFFCVSRCWKLNIFPGLLVWFWSIIDWFFCVKVLKRRLLSPINSQKLNVCIEFVFPAAGENCLLLNIKFLLATCILLTSTLSNELSIQKKSIYANQECCGFLMSLTTLTSVWPFCQSGTFHFFTPIPPNYLCAFLSAKLKQ